MVHCRFSVESLRGFCPIDSLFASVNGYDLTTLFRFWSFLPCTRKRKPLRDLSKRLELLSPPVTSETSTPAPLPYWLLGSMTKCTISRSTLKCRDRWPQFQCCRGVDSYESEQGTRMHNRRGSTELERCSIMVSEARFHIHIRSEQAINWHNSHQKRSQANSLSIFAIGDTRFR